MANGDHVKKDIERPNPNWREAERREQPLSTPPDRGPQSDHPVRTPDRPAPDRPQQDE